MSFYSRAIPLAGDRFGNIKADEEGDLYRICLPGILERIKELESLWSNDSKAE